MRLYHLTMDRLDASDHYRFDEGYFAHLREGLGGRLHLFVATLAGHVCAAALVAHTGTIIQYHLGASDPEYLRLAPTKVILDEVSLWGRSVGARLLHLGGGVGARNDSLFHFKAGFSRRRHEFKIWRAVVDAAIYDQLVQRSRTWSEAHGLEAADGTFFPAYRRPTRSRPNRMISGNDS
jgi:hypothetical protein